MSTDANKEIKDLNAPTVSSTSSQNEGKMQLQVSSQHNKNKLEKAKKGKNKLKKKNKKLNREMSKLQRQMDILSCNLDYIWYMNGRDLQKYYDDIPNYMKLNHTRDSGFFFGSSPYTLPGTYIGKPASSDGHVLVVGGPGSGKTSGIMIQSLGTWQGSIIAIDVKPKGEMLSMWQSFNKKNGKRLMVFNPAEENSCRYDPFLHLREGGEDNLVNNAEELVLTLIPISPETREPFWRKSAQNLLMAVILYYYSLGASFIGAMIDFLAEPVKDTIKKIVDSENTAAKMFANRFLGLGDKTLSGIMMELSELLTLATDSMIMTTLNGDEGGDLIDWEKLSTSETPFDVLIQIPEDKLEQWAPLTTLIINQLIKTLERRAEKTSDEGKVLPPILIMLDEFPRLGKIPAIKSGLATLRSRGVTIVPFIQSITQLDDVYDANTRKVIMDTCQYKAILNVLDPDSQEYFSKAIGVCKVPSRSFSKSYNCYNDILGFAQQIGEVYEPIILPHEFATLKNTIMLTPDGFCAVDKQPYFNDTKESKYYVKD